MSVSSAKPFRIDVWSDVVCPWCYIGKRRLERALAEFPNREEVEVVWHSFELDPKSPKEHDATKSHAERLSTKLGCSKSEAEGMIKRVADLASADGIGMQLEKSHSGNTFDAHRLIHLGKAHGIQDAVKERFFKGYMTEGESIGNTKTLERLAVDAGLPAEEVRSVLESDRYAEDVRADEEEAQEIGVRGVPFFVLGERYAVSGAQPAELLTRAITEAWKEAKAKPTPIAETAVLPDGTVCGPDGCA